jgi:hypothetical protein
MAEIQCRPISRNRNNSIRAISNRQLSSSANAPETITDSVDLRLVFLARAYARLLLVEAGEMDLDTAVADLVPPCACAREITDRWERQYPPRRQRRRRP